MTATKASQSSSCRKCLLVVAFIVLLQAMFSAVTYMYFISEMKQVACVSSVLLAFIVFEMQDKYFKSSIACLFKEDGGSWDPAEEESMNDLCWQVRWELRQFVKKIRLTSNEETISTGPEKQVGPRLMTGLQRAAAHITGNRRSAVSLPVPNSKNEKALGQKITSWESSRNGHSFLNNLHLRKGELVVHQTGFYYIYSQTYFRFQEDPPTVGSRRKNKQMVQYIYKVTSYPDPILLMKSARNSCWSEDAQYGLYSIYQGGIFELQENDRIFVSVTNEQLIDMDQQASYFGAFLVG